MSDNLFDSQDESSEEFIGEWMEKRGVRKQIVLATKVSRPFLRQLDSRLTSIGNPVLGELQAWR